MNKHSYSTFPAFCYILTCNFLQLHLRITQVKSVLKTLATRVSCACCAGVHAITIYIVRTHAHMHAFLHRARYQLSEDTHILRNDFFILHTTVRYLQEISSREIYLLKFCMYFMFAAPVINIILLSYLMIYLA
jgi:hypothetical protein